MKYKLLVPLALMLAVSIALGTDLSLTQSVTGNGRWEATTDLGTAQTTAGGNGDMALASKGTLSEDGAYLQSGVDFKGTGGYMTIGSTLIEYGYGMRAKNANSLSIRSKIDTLTSEETQDSVIGTYKMYGLTVNAKVDGDVGEELSNGLWMGRPVIISDFRGIEGNWSFNNTYGATAYSNAIKEA